MKKWIMGVTAAVGAAAVVIGIAFKMKKDASISIIGGADGPTAVFLAGEVGSGFSVGIMFIGILLLFLAFLMYKRKRNVHTLCSIVIKTADGGNTYGQNKDQRSIRTVRQEAGIRGG